MIRATTGGVLKSYRSSLMNSFISMNKSRNTVLSQRNFNSYAEDPAAAAKAFRLRKSRMTVDSQHDICNDTLRKYQAGFSCLQSIDEVLDTSGAIDGSFMNTLHGATLSWLNDPNGDAREQLTKALDQMSESLVQTMNQKYGDDFIFAGADGHNVPFEIKDNKLYYRGVPVDAMEPELKQNNGNPVQTDDGKNYVLDSAKTVDVPQYQDDPANPGNPLTVTADDGTKYYVNDGATAPIDTTTYDALTDEQKKEYTIIPGATPPTDNKYYKTSELTSEADHEKLLNSVLKDENGDPITATINGKQCYISDATPGIISTEDYETACKDAEKLKYLANEKYFVDIGLGFQEDENGKLIESSGFNAALNGINFIGYGLDEDGDPKNLYSLVQKMKEISDSVPEGGDWKDVYDDFYRLVQKFEKGASSFKTEFTNLAASTDKLEINEKLLSDNFYSLQEQYAELEDVDMVDALTSFLWAEYSYNAALKVGNTVLSQSLMDYLT